MSVSLKQRNISSSSMSSYFDINRTPTPINHLSINKKFTFNDISHFSSSNDEKKSKLSQLLDASYTFELSPTPCHSSYFLNEPPKGINSKSKDKSRFKSKSKSTSDLSINTSKLDSFTFNEVKQNTNNKLLKRRGLSQIPKITIC
jgi:hypothetical protein